MNDQGLITGRGREEIFFVFVTVSRSALQSTQSSI